MQLVNRWRKCCVGTLKTSPSGFTAQLYQLPTLTPRKPFLVIFAAVVFKRCRKTVKQARSKGVLYEGFQKEPPCIRHTAAMR